MQKQRQQQHLITKLYVHTNIQCQTALTLMRRCHKESSSRSSNRICVVVHFLTLMLAVVLQLWSARLQQPSLPQQQQLVLPLLPARA